MERVTILCPFCEAQVKAVHFPEVVRVKRQHTATFGSRTHFIRTKEKYDVLEDCPKCGKSRTQVQKALIEGVSKPKSKEEVRKQLEEIGLLEKFEGKG